MRNNSDYNKNYKSGASFDNDGFIKQTNGFGKNFTAPGREKFNTQKSSITEVKRSANKIFISKSPLNKEKEEEKLKSFFENNKIKKQIEERDRELKLQAEEKARAEEIKNSATQYYFNIGERVFHEKLGVGNITDVIQIGDSTMYTIDFGKLGKKAMDASYANLKKF